MERDITGELVSLLLPLGLGFVMGTVYDFLRIVRVGLPHALRKLWELGYVTACSLWFFGVCLRLDSEIRGSMLVALFAGAALYGLSLRPVLCRLWDKIVCWETIQAGKVERIWKKILIFVKKLFAKLQRTAQKSCKAPSPIYFFAFMPFTDYPFGLSL